MNLSWNAIDGIMQRVVKPGLERRKARSPKRLGADEMSKILEPLDSDEQSHMIWLDSEDINDPGTAWRQGV
jgi:hypothetical protein